MKRVFACVGFSMAVALVVLCFVKPEYILILTVGLTVLLAVSLVLPKFRQAVVLPLSLASAVTACLLYVGFTGLCVQPVQALDGTTAECTFYATDIGAVTSNSKGYCVKVTQMNGEKTNFNTYIYTDSRSNLRPYKEYNGRMSFFSIADNPFLSYGKYADRIYIAASCRLTGESGKTINSPYRYIVDLRQSIRNKLLYIMSDDAGALSVALVTGDKSYLDKSIRQAFTYSGMSHIMAVSGLHLAVAVGGVLYVLKRLKLKPWITNSVCIALTLLYMALAGFSGSVTRAGIMMIVMLLAGLFSMRGDTLNSLGIAVTAMCVSNPLCVTDIGTVLSVLAVLSLVTLYPHFSKRMFIKPEDPLSLKPKEKLYIYIQKAVSPVFVSISVVVYTLPVMYLFFGYTSVVGPVANIIAVPLGSICVVASLAIYLVSLLGITPITAFAVLVCEFFDTLLIKVCTFFAQAGNVILGLDYRFGVLIAVALLVVAVGFAVGKNKSVKVAFAVTGCVCAVCFSILLFNGRSDVVMRVFPDGAIVCTYDSKTVVCGVNTKGDYYKVKSYLQSNMLYVDFLVADNTSSYCAMLSNDVGVNTLFCDEFDDTILLSADCKRLEVQSVYNVLLDDDYNLCYNQGGVTLYIKDFSISTYQNADFTVNSDTATDSTGCIELKNGTVDYRISSKDSYKVRRLNQWQK